MAQRSLQEISMEAVDVIVYRVREHLSSSINTYKEIGAQMQFLQHIVQVQAFTEALTTLAWTILALTIVVLGFAAAIQMVCYIRIWHLRRSSRFVGSTTQPVGAFKGPFGKQYYRPHVGGQLYEIVPSKIVVEQGGSIETGKLDLVLVPCSEERDESILPGSSLARPCIQSPGYLVQIGLPEAGDDVTILGAGVRLGQYLITARHLFEKSTMAGYRSPYVTLIKNGFKQTSRLPEPIACPVPSGTDTSCSWLDLVAYDLGDTPFSVIKAKSLRMSDLQVYADSTLEVYGQPGDKLLVSTGAVIPDDALEASRGVFKHTANTVSTFSGSPVVISRSGSLKMVGLHLCGGDRANYGITSSAIMAFLRYHKEFAQWVTPTSSSRIFRTLLPKGLEETPLEDESRQGKRRFAHFDYGAFYTSEEEERNKEEERIKSYHYGDTEGMALGLNPSRKDIYDDSKVADVSKQSSPRTTPESIPKRPSPSTKLDRPCRIPRHLIEGATIEESVSKAATANQWPKSALPFHNGEKHTWAKTTKDTRDPLEARDLTQQEACSLQTYFLEDEITALDTLVGVGARSLLRLPAFAEFNRYINAGNINLDPEAVSKYGAPNLLDKKKNLHAYPCGTCSRTNGVKKRRCDFPPAYLEALRSLGPKGQEAASKIEGYRRPPSGSSDIFDSLAGQCGRQIPGNWDTLCAQPLFEQKVEAFCSNYSVVPSFTDTSVSAHVDRYADNADGDKSAGWSSRYRAGNKSAWTGSAEGRDLLAYLVSCRLALRVAEGPNLHYLSAEDVVRCGLKDPEDCIVKDEVHMPEKAAARRWRLIWITSIVDAATQELSHHGQNKMDIMDYSIGRLNVQAVGLGHHDDGIARLGEAFDKIADGGSLGGSDASGWDLSVCADLMYFDAERRTSRLPRVDLLARDILWAEAAVSARHLLVVGSDLMTFTNFGVVGSGMPSTSATASPGRIFGLLVCGADAGIAATDDAVQRGSIDEALLSTTGIIVKEGSRWSSGPEGPVNFTSHIFTKTDGKWGATYDNFPKMLASLGLKHVGEDPETGTLLPPPGDALAGMRFALRHTPEADSLLVALCERLNWLVPSPLDVDVDV